MGFLKIAHSVQIRGFSIYPKLNIFAYLESTRRDDHNGGWHVAGNGRTRPHAPPCATTRTEDSGVSDSPARSVLMVADIIADVSLTQSATQLVGAEVSADVSDDVADDVSFDPTLDPTRPTRILTRPGQRSTTRPGQ